MRAVYRGEARLHSDIAKKLMEKLAHDADHSGAPEELTEREIEVVRLVAKGLSNHEIADKLIISEKTVMSMALMNVPFMVS